MSYEKAEMKKFRIVTDAVTTEVEAMDEDAAAIAFGRSEPVYGRYTINCVADLIWAAKQMGGSADVREI